MHDFRGETLAFAVPSTNEIFFKLYASFIAKVVKQYDRIGRYTEDIFQDVCMHLVAANFLGVFNQSSQGKVPLLVTGAGAVAILGISRDQWITAQRRREELTKALALGQDFHPSAWAPCPVNVRADGSLNNGLRKGDLFYTEEVLETKCHWHKFHQEPISFAIAEAPTRAKFENYLRRAVRNYVKNYFRTLGRHDRDIYLEPKEDGSAWEAELEDGQREVQEEMVDLSRVCNKLGHQSKPLLKLLEKANMKKEGASTCALQNALMRLNLSQGILR